MIISPNRRHSCESRNLGYSSRSEEREKRKKKKDILVVNIVCPCYAGIAWVPDNPCYARLSGMTPIGGHGDFATNFPRTVVSVRWNDAREGHKYIADDASLGGFLGQKI